MSPLCLGGWEEEKEAKGEEVEEGRGRLLRVRPLILSGLLGVIEVRSCPLVLSDFFPSTSPLFWGNIVMFYAYALSPCVCFLNIDAALERNQKGKEVEGGDVGGVEREGGGHTASFLRLLFSSCFL